MRDPERINEIIQELWQCWKKHPDLRLGQLIYVLVSKNTQSAEADIFQPEDDLWLKWIKEGI